MGHYFPNWVINNGEKSAGLTDPQAWLDKHVFSLYAVGGPFLGARAGLKAVLSGDDMGIGEKSLFAPFIFFKNDHFTKTGSGQT
jgi:hypothetical protein